MRRSFSLNLCVIAILFSFSHLAAQSSKNPTANDKEYFIESFSMLAVVEMKNHGIPASIKLAQAILESNWGISELATKGNNFYGIKCKASWNGEEIYREDDDLDANGNLIKSCFRKYSDPSESFEAHSMFLKDNQRYHFLFDLGNDDYIAWAKGLKKAGYATNPKYPEILINIIETYNLDKYDNQVAVSQYKLTPKFNAAPAQAVSANHNIKIEQEENPQHNSLATEEIIGQDEKVNTSNNIYGSIESQTPPSAVAIPDTYRPKKRDVTEKGGSKQIFYTPATSNSVIERGLNENTVQLQNKLSSRHLRLRSGR